VLKKWNIGNHIGTIPAVHLNGIVLSRFEPFI